LRKIVTQTFLVNVVSAVAFIAALALEHFGIVPVGTEKDVLLVVAGLMAGTGSVAAVKGAPVLTPKTTAPAPVTVATPTQGSTQAQAPVVDPGVRG
jgi:hypothetical protein